MNAKISQENPFSIAVSVEPLAESKYADLVRYRAPGTKSAGKRAIAVSYKDLIVITKRHNEPLGALAAALDGRLNGAVSAAMDSANFQAKQGETLLVGLEERGLGSGNARNVLVVGLGDRNACSQFVYCGLVGCVLTQVPSIGCEQVILPLADLFDKSETDKFRHFGAIMHCRLGQQLLGEEDHGRLKKIRLVVDESVKDALEAGLAHETQVCRICSGPTI